MFGYNARREEWIQENDVSASANFWIRRPNVYIFVSDKIISTLESVFKNSGYGRKMRWLRVDASRIRKKNCVFTNLRIRVDRALINA